MYSYLSSLNIKFDFNLYDYKYRLLSNILYRLSSVESL